MNGRVRVAVTTGLMLLGAAGANGQAKQPPPVRVVLPDQYEQTRDSAGLRGDVVVMLYGDRGGTEANRELGELLHVQFHPAAKGLPPEKARQAPVAPLPGVQPGRRTPDVHVVPVACVGKVPGVVEKLIRSQVRSASPDVPVWLDFGEAMKEQFGLSAGEPNLVVIDAWGRLRFRASGRLDAKTYARLVQVIDYLRREAAGLTPPATGS